VSEKRRIAQYYYVLKSGSKVEGVLLISKVGGFLARKGDGTLGVKVIWRGLSRLHGITLGWLVARSR
jgi:hypothetical protein